MKKIRIGSFPLTPIKREDRHCLDRFLIKNLSDSISISDAIRNLNATKDLLYVTPDAIIQNWLASGMSNTQKFIPTQLQGKVDLQNQYFKDNTNVNRKNELYEKTMQRAFFIMGEFYKKVKNAPFYNQYIYYPIYVEKVKAVDLQSTQSTVDLNTQLDFSFLLISNDLCKDLKIDEIHYDENASLNFLYLFVEFFSSRNSNCKSSSGSKSLIEMEEKDIEFLIKLYQYIEETNRDPIYTIGNLYTLLMLIKKYNDSYNKNGGKEDTSVVHEIRQYFNQKTSDTNDDNILYDFERYSHIVTDRLLRELRNAVSTTKSVEYRTIFLKFLKILLEDKKIHNVLGDIEDTDKYVRYEVANASSKYKEILILAKELVNYNKIEANEIYMNDPFNFEFKISKKNYRIEKLEGTDLKIKDNFKIFIEVVGTYLDSYIRSIIPDSDEVQIDITDKTSTTTLDNIPEVKLKTRHIAENTIDITRLNAEIAVHVVREAAYRAAGDHILAAIQLTQIKNKTNEVRDLHDKNHILEVEIDQLKLDHLTNVNKLEDYKIDNHDDNITEVKEIVQNASKNILRHVSQDFAFLMDDCLNIFTNNGVIELIVTSIGYQVYTVTSFDTIRTYPIITADEYQKFIINLYKRMDDTLHEIAISIYTYIKDEIFRPFEFKLSNAIIKKAKIEFESNYFSIIDELYKNIKLRFVDSFLKHSHKYFKKIDTDSKIEYDNSIEKIHPILKHMLKNKNNFKSFIISYELIDELYRVFFVMESKKFVAGVINKMHQKINNPRNRMEYVLESLLGLCNNPVWIISKTHIFLSMPDKMSLSNTKILNAVPKEDIKKICEIKEEEFWSGKKMGKTTQIENPKEKEIKNKIKKIEQVIFDESKRLKSSSRPEEKKKIYKRIETKEEEISKLTAKLQEIKNVDTTPEGFVFNNKSESRPLLDKREEDNLKNFRKELEVDKKQAGVILPKQEKVQEADQEEKFKRSQYEFTREEYEEFKKYQADKNNNRY